MSWMKALAEGKKTKRGSFLTDGNYRLSLVNLIENKNGYKGYSIVAEVVVRESSTAREGIVPLPVGARGSIVFNFSTSKTAPANAKSLMEALVCEMLPETEEEIKPVFDELVSPSQPMRGRDFFARSFYIEKTQTKGHEYTGFNFSPTTQTDAEQAESRKQIETTGV